VPRLALLLPARNAAADLPGWFAAVEGFADAVVALDDGSTDETGAILASQPAVSVLLRNPVRATYAGWDDRANRQALLDACADLEVDWILQLDADERLHPDDARALRTAIDHGLLDPDDGYLLQVLRVVDGSDGYDEDHLWVGRLFGHRPGAQLPEEALHLVPLPEVIPPERRRRTTLRILHHGSATPERRAARVAKYREADPDHRWQASYERLAIAPREVRRAGARPPQLPVVRHRTASPEIEAAAVRSLGAGAPLVSVIVISRDDEDVIHRSLCAIESQVLDGDVEVIVVTSGTDATASIVRAQHPDARLIVLDHPALPGEARNAGLAVATGRYVTFPGSHVELLPGSLDARVARHLEGWAMVAGSVHNGTGGAAGWATYFLDHAGVLPGRPTNVLDVAPGACSYLREAIAVVGGFPEDVRAGEDTIVNTALFDLGYGAIREQAAGYVHHSRCRTIPVLVRHHHERGRGLGQMILRSTPPDRPLVNRRRIRSLGLRYVPARLHRTHRYTMAYGGELRGRWLRVAPVSLLAILGAWTGVWRELLRPGAGALDRIAGGPHGARRLARAARASVGGRLARLAARLRSRATRSPST
jgi:glycosyltransferase involved in cell wall biosynthesis